MQQCVSCGHSVNNKAVYCPNCGCLLPDKEEQEVMSISEFNKLGIKKASPPPEGMVMIDQTRYEELQSISKNLEKWKEENGDTTLTEYVYEKKYSKKFWLQNLSIAITLLGGLATLFFYTIITSVFK